MDGPAQPRRQARQESASRAAEVAASGRRSGTPPHELLALQRAAGNAAVVAAVQRAAATGVDTDSPGAELARGTAGPGARLDEPLLTEMQARLGADFGDVRVHTGAHADSSARAMGAVAYTAGTDIVFSRGQFDPGTTAGKTLLAHELTHVVQQRRGPVAGTQVGQGVSVSDPHDAFEREAAATAARVMRQPTPTGSEP